MTWLTQTRHTSHQHGTQKSPFCRNNWRYTIHTKLIIDRKGQLNGKGEREFTILSNKRKLKPTSLICHRYTPTEGKVIIQLVNLSVNTPKINFNSILEWLNKCISNINSRSPAFSYSPVLQNTTLSPSTLSTHPTEQTHPFLDAFIDELSELPISSINGKNHWT